MPSEAFFNLDKEKREKIIESMKNEFGANSFEKASVKKIVEDAGISKGSFWFYFESKEEAINFIIESYIEEENFKALELLKKHNGDIFETYIELYDFIVKPKCNKERKELFPNIFKDLIINKEKIFNRFQPNYIPNALIQNELFRNSIDLTKTDIKTEEEIFSLVKILNYIMRSNGIDSILGKVTKEEAKNNFLREIEFLRKGVYKND